jgi:hypothetical protein
MARQPMPKTLSPLQSDQRSYTSEFSVGELVWYPRSCCRVEEFWVGEWVSWYPGKRKGTSSSPVTRVAAVTMAAELLWYIQSWVGRLRESGETQLYCIWVYDCNKSNCQSNTRLRSPNAWQYVEWSDRGLIWGTILGYAWRDWGIPRKASVRTAGVAADIRTGRSEYTLQELSVEPPSFPLEFVAWGILYYNLRKRCAHGLQCWKIGLYLIFLWLHCQQFSNMDTGIIQCWSYNSSKPTEFVTLKSENVKSVFTVPSIIFHSNSILKLNKIVVIGKPQVNYNCT